MSIHFFPNSLGRRYTWDWDARCVATRLNGDVGGVKVDGGGGGRGFEEAGSGIDLHLLNVSQRMEVERPVGALRGFMLGFPGVSLRSTPGYCRPPHPRLTPPRCGVAKRGICR